MMRACVGSPIWQAGLLGLTLLVMICVATASTASNSVPSTVAGSVSDTLTAAALAPSGCANAAGLTATVLGPSTALATVPGTSANELILAGASGQTLGEASGGGSDCCVGTNDTTTQFLASCVYGINP